jgi:hypothetical protein
MVLFRRIGETLTMTPLPAGFAILHSLQAAKVAI